MTSEDQQVAGERDKLPVMRWLEYEYDHKVVDVRLIMAPTWPDLQVRIVPRSQGIEITGTFSRDGVLQRLEINAVDATRGIATVQIRTAALVSALKEWHAVARDMAKQILRGTPDQDVVVDAKPAAEALRILSYEAVPKRQTRKRGADAEALIQQVVDAYREALANGDPSPRKTVADKFGYSNEHIGRLLTRARQPRNGKPPLLGPAQPGRAGEVQEVGSDD